MAQNHDNDPHTEGTPKAELRPSDPNYCRIVIESGSDGRPIPGSSIVCEGGMIDRVMGRGPARTRVARFTLQVPGGPPQEALAQPSNTTARAHMIELEHRPFQTHRFPDGSHGYQVTNNAQTKWGSYSGHMLDELRAQGDIFTGEERICDDSIPEVALEIPQDVITRLFDIVGRDKQGLNPNRLQFALEHFTHGVASLVGEVADHTLNPTSEPNDINEAMINLLDYIDRELRSRDQAEAVANAERGGIKGIAEALRGLVSKEK